jgi:hypothetical protein
MSSWQSHGRWRRVNRLCCKTSRNGKIVKMGNHPDSPNFHFQGFCNKAGWIGERGIGSFGRRSEKRSPIESQVENQGTAEAVLALGTEQGYRPNKEGERLGWYEGLKRKGDIGDGGRPPSARQQPGRTPGSSALRSKAWWPSREGKTSRRC